MKWMEEIKNHCESKYHDPTVTEAILDAAILTHKNEGKVLEAAGTVPPTLKMSGLLDAKNKQKSGKSNGGLSPLVPEMLKCVPILMLYIISHLFVKRFQGVDVEAIPSWAAIVLCFLPKIARPKCMKHMRGICLLDILSKVYMSMIINYCRAQPPPVHWRQFAISPTRRISQWLTSTSS